jgi:hypothetical protein
MLAYPLNYSRIIKKNAIQQGIYIILLHLVLVDSGNENYLSPI